MNVILPLPTWLGVTKIQVAIQSRAHFYRKGLHVLKKVNEWSPNAQKAILCFRVVEAYPFHLDNLSHLVEPFSKARGGGGLPVQENHFLCSNHAKH